MFDLKTIACLIAVIYSVAFPALLLVWWKTKAKIWCFVTGAICCVLFAMLLEQVVHAFCIYGDNAVAKTLKDSPVIYTLYGALMAGIFEETGRLFGYKVLLRKHTERECALAYGIGHGGAEVIIVLGITYFVYLLAKCGVPVGNEEATAQVMEAANGIKLPIVGAAMFERISAMLTHIGLSMIMFVAAKQKGKLWLYPVAIFMHALLDVPAMLYQLGTLGISISVVESAALVMGVIYLLIGRNILNKYSVYTEEETTVKN